MSDWNSIWQGIGQLGQTKKDMLTPVLDAHRNRGKILSEGLGRISDTIGGIANRRKTMKFQTGEREAGEAHDIAMQTSEQNYQANENVLNRALERDKIWASLFEGTQDRDAMRKEAALDRQLQRELRAAAEAATNERQKAELDEQVRQFDVKVDQWKQEFDRQGLQWDDEMGLKREGLAIDKTKADKELSLLQYQLAREQGDSNANAAFDAILPVVQNLLSKEFNFKDEMGQWQLKSLAELDNEQLQRARVLFDERISQDPNYGKYREGIMKLFDIVGGVRPPGSEVPQVPKGEQEDLARLGERINKLEKVELGQTDVPTTGGVTAGDVFADAELKSIIGKEKDVWLKIKQLNTMAEKLSADDISAISDATNDIIDNPMSTRITESPRSGDHIKKLQAILDRLKPGYRGGGYPDIE